MDKVDKLILFKVLDLLVLFWPFKTHLMEFIIYLAIIKKQIKKIINRRRKNKEKNINIILIKVDKVRGGRVNECG